MQLKQIGAVFLIAFMCTGMFGFVLNTEMVTIDAKSYSGITPGESIVYNTGVNQWEEYNPVTNITGQFILTKKTGGDPQETLSNVYLPITQTPSKYIYSKQFKGYHQQTAVMNTDWNYSPNFIERVNYQDFNPFHWVHYVGYPMKYMTPGGDNRDSGNIQNARVYTDTMLHFMYWGGFSQDVLSDSQHTDYNKDWINHGSAETPNYYSIPQYGGGYGITNWGSQQVTNYETDFEIRMKVDIYDGPRLEQNAYKTYYNSPKAQITMFPIATKIISGDTTSDMADKTVIGVSDTTGSGNRLGLYGLAYVGNYGNLNIIGRDDVHNYSEEGGEGDHRIMELGLLQYDYKLTQLDDTHGAWIYDEPTKLFYPATRTQTGEYQQDTTCTGVRYLVFYHQTEGVSEDLRKNWSRADMEVQSLQEPDYPSMTYPESDVPVLRVWEPVYGQVEYLDPYKWTVINTTTEPVPTPDLFNGALLWDNGERTGVIKYWGQPGLRVGANNIHDGSVYNDVPHSNVWWTIPEDKYPYKYYICTIDLLNKTATCEGVIGDPENPLDYRTSGVVYDMVAYSDLHEGQAPTDEWPGYFDSADKQSAVFVTYSDYNPQNYGTPNADISVFKDIRFYVLSTIVSTDPDGKLWSDPQFYLGYYLPDVFGGKSVDHIFELDEGKIQVNIPVYLTNNNGRFVLKNSVAYGKSLEINGETFTIKDGQVTLEVSDGKYKDYTVNGLQVEYLMQYSGTTPIGTKVYLTHINHQDLWYPVGGVTNGSYSWETYYELRGWMNPEQIEVHISAESTIEIPVGTLIKGNGIWYFSSDIDSITITHVQKKALSVDSGVYTLSVAGSVMIFLGISLVGLAGLCYYTNQRIPMLGWIAIGGVVLIALQLMFAFAH